MVQPALTPAPTPPALGDPATFAARANAFVAWQANTFTPEVNGFIDYFNANKLGTLVSTVLENEGPNSNQIELTSPSNIPILTPGLMIRFRAATTNVSGPMTIAVDGASAAPALAEKGVEPPAGYIRPNVDHVAVFQDEDSGWLVFRRTEYGLNANGRFWKFGDGRGVAFTNYTVLLSVGALAGSIYRRNEWGVAAPMAFAGDPVVSSLVAWSGAASAAPWLGSTRVGGGTTVNFMLLGAVNGAAANVKFAFHGWWY